MLEVKYLHKLVIILHSTSDVLTDKNLWRYTQCEPSSKNIGKQDWSINLFTINNVLKDMLPIYYNIYFFSNSEKLHLPIIHNLLYIYCT